MKKERVYAPKVSTRVARRQAILDMTKEKIVDYKGNMTFRSVTEQHIKMTPKKFISCLPVIQLIPINENNSQYFKKSNKL